VLAGRLGDGLITTSRDKEIVEAFTSNGSGKPHYGQLTVCWAAEEAAARKTAHQWWPNAALGGELSQELLLPRHFEQATATVRDEDVAKSIVCGPDAARHRAAVQEFLDSGVEHVYLHHVRPDQDGFFKFYEQEVLPYFSA
jgi:G6PDH family F420-dependent oxidoreductase